MMERNNMGVNGMEKGIEQGKNGGKKWDEIIIRVLVLLLTLVAAILIGVNKQTKIVAITISPDLPAFNVPVTAKSSYVSAFVYFVVANSIACVFTAVTLVATFARKGGRTSLLLFTTMLIDVMMVALLFSCVGAAGAVGVLGAKGNSHLRWNKVCDVYTKYCHQVEAAIALSFFAAVAYVLLLLLEVSKLQRSRY
ncbi:CASP-like protein 1E1 [Silene latifolia]|uniref:CASP-like protein 1E1 n=1 Tax=Silene latifolia TaxID=37657 RepID=UPI003D786AF0